MRIANLAPETWEPTWNENQSLPESERVKIEIKYPTVAEWENLTRERGRIDPVEVVQNHVTRVHNLTIGDTEVTNGAQLIEQRRNIVYLLVSEIFAQIALQSNISSIEGREKN